MQNAEEVQNTSGHNILGSGLCTVPTLLRLMPVIVLKLVAVAFSCCPWTKQGEILSPEAAEIPVCLDWPWECPFLFSDYSKSFCFLYLEGRKDRLKL